MHTNLVNTLAGKKEQLSIILIAAFVILHFHKTRLLINTTFIKQAL